MSNIGASMAQTDATLSAKAARRRGPPPLMSYATFGALFIFFLCLILNYQVDSDGTWYLYAMLLRRGVKLYADLHVAQQPFFFLESAWWQSILGKSWVFSQIPAIIHMFLYLAGFFLLSRKSNWQDWQKSAIFVGSVFAGVGWQFYHFGDYHVISDLCIIYAAIVLLPLVDGEISSKRRFCASVGLGMLCGICFATRANDGLLLYVAVAAVLFHALVKGRAVSLVSLSASTAATVLVILALTGDSFDNYVDYTIRGAVAIKGGSHQILFTPFMLAWDLIRAACTPASAFVLALVGGGALITWAWRLLQGSGYGRRPVVRVTFVTVALLVGVGVIGMFDRLDHYFIPVVLAPFILLMLYGLGIYVAAVVLRLRTTNNRRLVLLFVPFCALLASGMSSGGKQLGIIAPIGLFIALGPIVFSSTRVASWPRIMTISVCTFLAFSISLNKIESPISWQYYISYPIFLNRGVIDHPIYGKMVVDRRINGFFSSVCDRVRHSGGKSELFSLPYSYANYYCGVDPWGNYVQTWFDTTSPKTIGEIVRRLKSQPPAWILYQRQPRILRLHEVFYNHGERLAHRDLDEVIMGEVARGAWSIRTSWKEWEGDNWVLIRTAPVDGEAGQKCSAAIVARLKAVRDRGSAGPTDTFEWDRECA